MIPAVISATLLFRTIGLFAVSIFLLTAGLIAWHEVLYRKKNGLTTAIRDFCFGLGFETLMTSIMTFYAAFNGINTLPFLVMEIISVVALLYTIFTCWRLAMKMLEAEDV